MLHNKNVGPALAAALLTCILLTTVWPSFATGAPLEVYGRLPSLENVALSPNGTRLAMIRTLLLIHGKDDTVVTFDQSRDMYDAMKHAKKDVEMVTLKKEDHWLSRSETRLEMLQTSVAFLRAHNPPD